MPEVDDFAGSAVVPLFLCFLWVDFIESLESDFIESLLIESLPLFFIESLVDWVGVPAVEEDMGLEESWARAAPLTAIQPASIATISLVLRMTNLLEFVRLESMAILGAKASPTGRPDLMGFTDAIPFSLNVALAWQQSGGNRSGEN
jgi:hypothetical protein